MKILVTGATGYVGGRLIPRLLDQGHEVWALARHPEHLAGRSWSNRIQIWQGDLLDASSLPDHPPHFDAAYYLIHSMHGGGDFRQNDLKAVEHFADWTGDHVGHVIYLGGLLPQQAGNSRHLQSRADTGRLLNQLLPVTEFRAGPIIGSGSASFEMVRYLTERLPAMIAPRWIMNEVQTIAIRDVLNYLIAVLPHGPSGIIEIGSNRLTFRDMMLVYAEERGFKRVIAPVPVLAPTLAALWVGLVTPITNRLAVPLVQGVIHPVLANTDKAQQLFPDIRPADYRTSVQRALVKIDRGDIETRWTQALASKPYELVDWEGVIREVRRRQVDTDPEQVFNTVTSLGGEKGWLVWNWAWEARGILDQMIGGPGLRRGRRHPQELKPGETLDFWRVEKVEPHKLLRLRAEMKVPGKAWLQFEIEPGNEPGKAILTQTAFFRPKSLPGFLYWWLLYPLHALIFSDMINALVTEANTDL
ncbi:MAG: DUF2867 domain-containing protein [Verrucomicrobiota bacterium]